MRRWRSLSTCSARRRHSSAKLRYCVDGSICGDNPAVRSCVPDACESCRPEPSARARDVSRANLGWSQSSGKLVCSPPHETRACPGFAYGCASLAGRTCGGEGVGVGVAVILLGSSSSMPSTLESSTPRLLASLRLAYLQLLSCGHLFVSLLRPPPLAPPQPAAGLPASGKHKSDQPRQAGVGLGEGNAPIMRQLS